MMGYHLVGEVLGHAPDLPYRDFRVLVALALDATDSTRLAKPGHELLALHGNCSMRTAGRAVGRLEARGYVKVVGHPGPGRRAVYAILPMPGAPGSERASERRPRTVAGEHRPLTVAGDHQPPEDPNTGHLTTNTGHLSAERTPLTVADSEPYTGTLDLNPFRASPRTPRTGSRGRAAVTGMTKKKIPRTDIPESEWKCRECGLMAAEGVRFAAPPDLCADCAAKAEAPP